MVPEGLDACFNDYLVSKQIPCRTQTSIVTGDQDGSRIIFALSCSDSVLRSGDPDFQQGIKDCIAKYYPNDAKVSYNFKSVPVPTNAAPKRALTSEGIEATSTTNSNGISGAALAGIVAGSVVGAILILLIIFFLFRGNDHHEHDRL